MNVLVTGKGGASGSWAIRGTQLGAALGATVKPMASLADCQAADVIVVVKRTPAPLIDAVRRSGRPWVLDLVDGWPQPCDWDESRARAWLQQRLADLAPSQVVYGTDRMREDAGRNGLVLPHHSWDRYVAHRPVTRDAVQVVGYEGSPAYLGAWRIVLEHECRVRGWAFEVNGDMRRADIGIAMRDDPSHPGRWWKPGTKLSNLHALAIPALCTPDAGNESVASGAEFWIHHPDDVGLAFDRLEQRRVREAIGATMRSAMLHVEHIAEDYLAWLKLV